MEQLQLSACAGHICIAVLNIAAPWRFCRRAIWGAVMAARKRHASSGSGSSSVLPHVVASCIEHPAGGLARAAAVLEAVQAVHAAHFRPMLHGAAAVCSCTPPNRLSSPLPLPAVLETLAAYEAQGLLTYTTVPVDSEGRVSAADIAAAIRQETCLVTLMHRCAAAACTGGGGLHPANVASCKLQVAAHCRLECSSVPSKACSAQPQPSHAAFLCSAATMRSAACSLWRRWRRQRGSGVCWCTATPHRWAESSLRSSCGTVHASCRPQQR